MRIILATAALLYCTTASAQEFVFRASPPEAVAVKTLITKNDKCKCQDDCKCDDCDGVNCPCAPVVVAEKPKPVKQPLILPEFPLPELQPIVKNPVQNVVQSNRYTTEELIQATKRYYPNGKYYVRHADVSPRSAVWRHLKAGNGNHGFGPEVDGLSQNYALMIHDMEHGGEISPFKPRTSTQVQQVNGCPDGQCPLVQPQTQRQVQQVNGCPNGQCPLVQPQQKQPVRVRLFRRR